MFNVLFIWIIRYIDVVCVVLDVQKEVEDLIELEKGQ